MKFLTETMEWNIEMQQFEEAGTEGGDEFMSFFSDFACVFMVLCHNYKRKKYVNENIANKK